MFWNHETNKEKCKDFINEIAKPPKNQQHSQNPRTNINHELKFQKVPIKNIL